MFIAPLAGALSDKIFRRADRRRPRDAGGRARLDGVGDNAHDAVLGLIGPFVVAGVGMALFFAPVQTSSSRRCGLRRRQVVRREQRDPRAGRRVRRGGARLDLRPRRRLRHAARASPTGCTRPSSSAPGRRPRSARRVHDPAQATRNRGAQGRARARGRAGARLRGRSRLIGPADTQSERPRKGPFDVAGLAREDQDAQALVGRATHARRRHVQRRRASATTSWRWPKASTRSRERAIRATGAVPATGKALVCRRVRFLHACIVAAGYRVLDLARAKQQVRSQADNAGTRTDAMTFLASGRNALSWAVPVVSITATNRCCLPP